MITLPNGKPIDMTMLEAAMDDTDQEHRYFLNLVTGEVVFLSEYLDRSEDDERLADERARVRLEP